MSNADEPRLVLAGFLRTVLTFATCASVGFLLGVAIVNGPFSAPTLVGLCLGVPAWIATGWALKRLRSWTGGSPGEHP